MIKFTVVDAATGRALERKSVSSPDLIRAQVPYGAFFVLGHMPEGPTPVANSPNEDGIDPIADEAGNPVPVPVAAVKAECRRRIEQRYPQHKQLLIARAPTSPACIAMWAFIDMMTAASNRIEQMAPIPHDFRKNRYWLGEGK